jgi:hypothetical protein
MDCGQGVPNKGFPADGAQRRAAADDVQILGMNAGEIFTAYAPNPRGPLFMTLIEKTFGAHVTTRTWDTVRKCAIA